MKRPQIPLDVLIHEEMKRREKEVYIQMEELLDLPKRVRKDDEKPDKSDKSDFIIIKM